MTAWAGRSPAQDGSAGPQTLIHTSKVPKQALARVSGLRAPQQILASIWRIEGAGRLLLCLRQAGEEVGGGFAPDTPEGFRYLVDYARSMGAQREGDDAQPPG